MKETDLMAGDVIFFENNYKDEDMQPSHDYIDHVAMYDGLNEKGEPMFIHAISSQQSYYHAEGATGLCKTTLRQLKNQLQKEDGFPDQVYDITYKVFRFKHDRIREQALAVMRKQAEYRLPYDEKRLNEKLAREETLEAHDFKELAESLYRSEGIYRSIKYAVRYPSMLTRTRINGFGRGLTCSMAVVLAFQIAELFVDKKIDAST